MKSNFRRLFFPMAVLILVSFLFLGICSQIFLYNYFLSANEEALLSNAKAVSELTSAYASISLPEKNLALYMDLSFSSRFSNTQTLLCSRSGEVILCSEDLQLCSHCGQSIGSDNAEKTIDSGQLCSTAMVSDIYGEKRLAVAVPITAYDGKCIGIVVSSMKMARIYAILRRCATVYIITAACVFSAALVFMLLFARRQNQPIKDLAAAARLLGHGQLDTRVPTKTLRSKEFGELAVAFNNMAASLQSADMQRQEFVANVSHELKTPMTTIAGYLDGMLDGTIPEEKQEHYMQLVASEVRRLSRLVRNMLDISRMQAQSIPEEKKARFNISETVGQVLVSFEQKINEKQLNIAAELPDEPIIVFADPDAILQVIYNLIDNAVKFCNTDGALGVRTWVQNGKANVSVSNTGPTIPDAELPLVFERFHKTDKSRSADRDGVGLGLYIVKTIICNHGEDIFVDSRDEKTTFSFTLPLAGKALTERGQQNES